MELFDRLDLWFLSLDPILRFLIYFCVYYVLFIQCCKLLKIFLTRREQKLKQENDKKQIQSVEKQDQNVKKQ